MDLPALDIAPHPLLRARAFVTELPRPLGEVPVPAWLSDLLVLDPPAEGRFPHLRSEAIRSDVRDVLRHGGYRPTGRGKPASEYLVRAAGEGGLDSINLAVDACNATSLASGFPISVVDLDKARIPLRIDVAEPGASYVFNASGQEIQLAGLVCLFDGEGPCANAVKDSQRTKTGPGTIRTLSVVWGAAAHAERVDEACEWYRALLSRAGAETGGL